MKHFSTLRSPSQAFRPSLEPLEPREVPSVTYISDSDGDLFTVAPETGATTQLGRMPKVMADIAVDPGGQLWGVELFINRFGPGRGGPVYLVRINSQNAHIQQRVGAVGVNGLGFRGNELFGVGGDGVYRINTADASTQKVYSVLSGFGFAGGDLAFDAPGNLYLTTENGDILRIDASFTGAPVVVASTGQSALYGLIFASDGYLYAFQSLDSGGGEKIYRIDPGSGATTVAAAITSSSVQGVYGAASAQPGATALSAESFGGPAVATAGQVETVMSLSATPANHPEGVAVDRDGVVFVGNRRAEGGLFVSEILKRDPDGKISTFATLGVTVSGGNEGVLGLTVDRGGDVYAAVVDFGFDGVDNVHGVWRIRRGGSVLERLPGSESIVYPNALTFDASGNLYVTDSFGGAVWRFGFGAGETFSVWVTHDLLAPRPDNPLGFNLPGANGIAFYPHPSPRLYVANTEKGLISRIPIKPDGTAGAPNVVADTGPFGALGTIDGIAVDVRGDIHGVIPGFAVLGTAPLVRVEASTGAITSTVIYRAEFAEFDVPLSLAFGTRAADRLSVFVTNGDLPGIPPEGPGEPGPGLLRVEVGVAGLLGSTSLTAAAATGSPPSTETLTPSQVEPLLAEAIARWQATGVDTSTLHGIDIRIADLGGMTIGLADGHTIWLDDDAAGWGWFVDRTPGDDREFRTRGDQGEQNHMDLLSVIAHELGHLFGLDHDDHDGGVMGATLTAGTRRTPTADAVKPVAPVDVWWPMQSSENPVNPIWKDRHWHVRRR